VALTGHRLVTTGVVLGLGIPMAVYDYYGQTLFSTELDWVAKFICAFSYAFFYFFSSMMRSLRMGLMGTLRLALLVMIEVDRPEFATAFTQTDLSSSILGTLRYLSRSECTCLGESTEGYLLIALLL
jgi:hypothetical protein